MKLIRSLALLLSISFLPLLSITSAQNLFTNGGLEGSIGSSVVPSGWSAVPYGTSFCEANMPGTATPDTTWPTGPTLGTGLAGNPHGGSTFVSGIYGGVGSTALFHEGIQQSVNLTAGTTYQLDLWQAVVKQTDIFATTGQWQVFLGNSLLWTTATTTSNLAFDDINLGWDARSFTFTASASGPTMISFMPYTPGGMQMDPNGVRMGIDDISLTVVPEPSGMMLLGSIGVLALLRRKRCAHQNK